MDNKLQLQDQLLDLVRRCTVKLTTSEGSSGTGFFVAPGTVLTCAHVIQEENQAQNTVTVTARWNQQSTIASIEKISKGYHNGLQMFYPDLALLQVHDFAGHPCVYLHNEVHFKDPLYSYGYIADLETGDSSSFESEDWTDENRLLLKLKGGLARPGLSGGPVLNPQTGGVCAVLKRSRDINSPTGGRAIPSHKVLEIFPELKDEQQKFHQQDKRWYNTLTTEQRKRLGMEEDKAVNDSNAIEVLFLCADVEVDRKWINKFEKHLALLQRQNLITTWHTGKLEPGSDIKAFMSEHLSTASIILLMISSDFMDYYRESNDVEEALARRKDGARVVPIILRASDWETSSFGGLQPLPYNRKPIKNWKDDDQAFLEVTQSLRKVVMDLAKDKRPA